MSQLFTIEDYFTNLGAKMSLGNELDHLGCQGEIFNTFCEQNRFGTVPIVISATLNQIKSR
jgi:hypothetical protein